MLLAVRGMFAAFDVQRWHLRAGVMYATWADDVHHAILSMFLAVRCLSAALDIEVRLFHAGLACATPHFRRGL